MPNYKIVDADQLDADLSALADKIRERSGTTEDLPFPAGMIADIDNISGGGGSGSAVVWFVSFMGADGSELFKMPVLDGDDCKNPVTHGDITTPTKESTAQYNYTYSGWSLTEGGTADTTNALAKVTEDRTVYAAFTSAVRYYTVTYYDSDGTTVLKTESLAYGATPSYAPTKGDYELDTWNPDSPVTGGMSYTAVWKLKPSFTTASWAEIKEICDSGNAASTFAAGQERTEIITYADGTSEEITWVVADFGNRIAGPRTAQKPASMVVMAKHALAKKQVWAESSTYYDSSYVHQYLTTTFYNALPEELRNAITPAMVDDWDTATVWLPDLKHLGFKKRHAGTSTAVNDREYNSSETVFDIFANGESLVKTLGANGSAVDYWLGNFYNYGSQWEADCVTSAGGHSYGAMAHPASYANIYGKGVVPCFCI